MRRFLLDINVLIALIDPLHVRHNEAHRWFEAEGQRAWASCPLTQLGVVRVVANIRYSNSPGSPSVVAESLRSLCEAGDHEFWPDDLDITENVFEMERVLQPAHLTDSYLLALAASKQSKLATFDRRLVTSAVPAGAQVLHVLL